jgi:hypothetical protein
MARKPDVDLAKIDATTDEDIRRHMREEGHDPDEAIRDEDIMSYQAPKRLTYVRRP